MTEKEIMIFEMISEGYSLNEMAHNLRLSTRQVHQKIQKLIGDGYFIKPLYFDDGNIRYVLEESTEKHTINLSLNDSARFKALVISDIHIGNELENLSYLYKTYDYARDNDIHVILNCGDLIDGNFTRGKQVVSDIDAQIERVIDSYPHDNNILNIICYGNHDYSSYESGRDIVSAISKRRPDLISGGYGFSLINIERDQFVLSHPLNNISFKPLPNKLILEGHHHRMLVKISRNNFVINVPPLSDLCFGCQENPGMVEMQLLFGSGFIHSGYFRQIGVKNNFEVFSETNFEFFLKHENLNEKKLLLKK